MISSPITDDVITDDVMLGYVCFINFKISVINFIDSGFKEIKQRRKINE
jgi:hypothetical protein